jgi:hypothetical protein
MSTNGNYDYYMRDRPLLHSLCGVHMLVLYILPYSLLFTLMTRVNEF